MSAAVHAETAEATEPPGKCAECTRLRRQYQAAAVLRDWSWLGRVRAQQRKHLATHHRLTKAGGAA